MKRTKLVVALCLATALSCGGPGKTDTTLGGPGGGGTASGGAGDGTPVAPALSRDEILAASDLPDPLAKPIDGDGMGVTIHRLSNGLTVYISTDRQKPRFTSWIAVRTGSRMDPADSTGLAHYLEHMLFKGTNELGTLDIEQEQVHLDRIAQLYDDLRKTEDAKERDAIFKEIDAETQKSSQFAIPNELDGIYSALGVTGLNAHTWHEETVYKAAVPANRFEAWVKVEAERFRDPRFRLFFPELEAVYEEKNRSLDSTARRMNYALHQTLYPKHPYGTQPTIGIVEHLKSPAYGDMVDYFHKWYVPNNIAIVLAGDIDAATAIPVLEREFGSWEPKQLSAPAQAEITPLSARQEVIVEAEGENSVTLTWPTVGVNHPDQPAIEVMDWIMASGSAGLIDVDLVLSQKLPTAGSSPTHYNEAGHWTMSGTAKEGQTHEDVEKLLLAVVAKLKSGGAYTQEDIDAIVLHAEMREMSESESNEARVSKIGGAFLRHQSWAYAASRSDRLRKVKASDVKRVADQYLTDNYAVVKRVKGKHSPPKIEKPKITPIEIDPSKQSEFARAVKAMPAEPLEPEWLEEGVHYQRATLPAGGILAAKNARNELFTVSYRFDMGSRDQKLLCFALDLMERSGTADMTAEELQTKLWRMGTSLNTGCGTDSVFLSISGVDRNLEESVGLLTSWLRTARLEDDALGKLVENTISRRKDRMEEPRVVGQALSEYAMRGKDSNFLLATSNQELKKATTANLGKLLTKLPDYQHRTTYFGPRDASAAAKIVPMGSKHKKVKARKPVTYRKTKGAEVFFIHKDVAQSQILFFMPKAPLKLADRPDAELYNGYVGGGMGGLVFQEIREARGLAYSAAAGHRAGNKPKDESGLFGFVGTQSDKTLDALNTILELLRNVPMQPDRLVKAKQSSDARYRASRVDPRSVAGWVMSWDDLGIKGDPRPGYWEGVQKLDEGALKRFADRFAQANVIISIMGDSARIDMKALGKVGKIRTLKVEELFNY